MNGANDQWLVKSANRVMGPFKRDEVVTGLKLKHFTIMDEIAAPFGRWILIRDEVALQEAVKEIRSRPDAIENTATLTQSMSQTMSISESNELDFANLSLANGNADKKLKKGRRSKSLWLSRMLTLIVVAIMISGGVYYFNLRKKQKEGVQEGLTQVMQLKSQGFYDRAFAMMTKLKTVEKNNSLLDMEVAIYQISIQNQNVIGRKSLERVITQLDNKDHQASVFTAIALSYLNENDFKNASDSINQALTINNSFLPALINKALIELKNGRPEVAEQHLESIISNINNGTIIIGSTLASIEVNRKGLMPMRILPVLVQMLDDYLKNNFEYQQEAYLLKAYIYNFLGQKESRELAMLDLLNSDLESGQGHRFDLLVDRSFVSWKNLLPYCQTINDADTEALLGRVLLAYCFSKAGMDLEAKKVILEIEAEAPRDPHVAAIKAYIMRLLGQESESQASLGIALSEKSILSSWLLKSKYCEAQKNEACVQETLTQLLKINSRSLPAYAGMAKLELRRGNKKEASDWVTKGLNLSQTFIPFWEIKNSL